MALRLPMTILLAVLVGMALGQKGHQKKQQVEQPQQNQQEEVQQQQTQQPQQPQKQQQQQQDECDIEECLLKLRDPDPVKEGDIKIFCARTAEGLACLDKCLDSPLYQATSPIVMGGVKQLLSEICAPGSSLGKRYLQESKCLNHQNTTVMDCATSMIEKYPSLISRPNPENIIRVFCCSIDKTEDCIVERVHKDCGRGAAKLVGEMMNKAFYPINQIICYFNDASQCPQF